MAGFDETGFRVDGRLHWVHCARTGTYTLLMVHRRRGTEAMTAMGILPSFAGVAVHDAWAPYDTYTGPDHQLCCAHALRELQALAPVTVVPGHGAPGPAVRLADMREYLQTLLDDTRAAYARGDGLMETVDRLQIPRFRGWALYDTYHRRNVHFAYLQIEEQELRR